MHEESIYTLKNESIRLAQSRLALLNDVEAMFKSNEQNSIMDNISTYKKILSEEIKKVEKMEMTLAVVGTMKSGKSTFINAITGLELLPNRELPMTTIPTIITHSTNCEIPWLELSNLELIKHTQQKLATNPQVLSHSGFNFNKLTTYEFKEIVEGIDEIKQALSLINDMLRMCHEVNYDFSIEAFDTLEQIPRITVNFQSLSGQAENKVGTFSVVDTPGVNEAEHRHALRSIFSAQIARSSAVLFVIDYTQFNSEATQDVKQNVERIFEIAKDKLFVVVNKFDENNRNSMNVEQTRNYVAETLFGKQLPLERIFPTSSLNAFLSNSLSKKLSLQNAKPHREEAWVMDFIKKTYGDTDIAVEDYQDETIERLKKRITSFYSKSLFAPILDCVINTLNTNSHFSSIESILTKLRHYSSVADQNIYEFFPQEQLIIKETSLMSDVSKMEQIIKSLQTDIKNVEIIEADIEKYIQSSLHAIKKSINDEVFKSFCNTKSKVEEIFNKRAEKPLPQQQVTSITNESTNSFQNYHQILKSCFNLFNKKKPIQELLQNDTYDTTDKDEAEELCKEINTIIQSIVNSLSNEIRRIFKKIIAGLETQIQDKLISEIEKVKCSIEDCMQEHKFSADIGLLNLPKKLNYTTSFNANYSATISKEGGYWYNEPGIGGFIKRVFSFGGMAGQEYEPERERYHFIKHEIIKSLEAHLNNAHTQILEQYNQIIADTITPPIQGYITTFKSKIEQLRSILTTTIHEKKTNDKCKIESLLQIVKDKHMHLQQDKASIELCNNQLLICKTENRTETEVIS